MRHFLALALALGTPAALGDLPEIALVPRTEVLRIAVTGDTGKGSEAVAAGIRKVHQAAPLDAIVLTGDNFYPCGVTSVDDPRWSLVHPLTRVGVPVLPILGNHDYCGKADPDAQIRIELPNWRFPARQYVVRARVADFVFVDTTLFMRGHPAPALPFSGATPWRVVVGHHSVISSGWHGYFPRDEVRRIRQLIPTLLESRVDLYVCGHDHHVELIRGRMLHLVSGAGSAPIRPIKLRTTTIFPDDIRRERIGFAVAEISASRIRVRFYDAKGKPRGGWIDARVRPQKK